MTKLSPVSVAFLLFPNVTQLDLTGPAQVLARLGNVKLDLVWKTLDPVMTDAGFAVVPTATLKDIRAVDILCVPGGLGTLAVMEDQEILDWLKHVATQAGWVTSVCTGSLVLGAAGLLKGYNATCHWASIDQLAYFGATPVHERIVYDRNRATGGGVTSGIDFAFSLMAQIRGDAHAKFVQLTTEYDPKPPFDSGTPEKAGAEMVARYEAIIESAIPDRDGQVRAIAERLGF